MMSTALLHAPGARRVRAAHEAIAVIPAYNDEATVGELVQMLARAGLTVIVVDDGSRDRTADVARRAGARVIAHSRNLGKGRALATGFRAALELGTRAVVTLDADGQHAAFDALRLVAERERLGVDLLVGDRLAERGPMPLSRFATNLSMSLLLAAVFGTRVRDSQCGLRVVSARLLESARLGCERFETESELLIEACRLRASIAQTRIATLYPAAARSRIRPLVDALRFFRLVAARAGGRVPAGANLLS
jgi:glycosyltransferase involved in cell wall biosynthesis